MALGALVEFIVETVFGTVGELVLQIFCYGTTYLLLPIVSLGKCYVESASIFRFTRPKWGGLHKDENGRYCMDAELASFLGFIFWLVALISLIVFT